VGLSSTILHDLFESSANNAGPNISVESPLRLNSATRVRYEFPKISGQIQPTLRLFIEPTLSTIPESGVSGEEDAGQLNAFNNEINPSLFRALHGSTERGADLMMNLKHVTGHEERPVSE
jgi:hypothetical protein